MSSVIVFILFIFGKGIVPKVVLELSVLALILLGLILGVIALLGIKKHGTQKLLLPSLIGMTANGLLLFIFITNFLTARSKVINQNIHFTGSPDGKTWVAAAMKSFENDSFNFQFEERYQLKESQETSQIFLQHPYSNVVITDHREKLNADESLKKFVAAVRADFERQNYTDISQGNLEKITLNKFSGFKIRLEYTRPANFRVVAELYMISSEKDSYSLMHYYPKNQNIIAIGLFNPVLNSFAEVETPKQLNELPNNN